MATIQEAIDKFVRRYPENESEALEYAKDIHLQVLMRLGIRVELMTIDPVASTDRYDLPSGAISILGVLYVESADNRYELERVSTFERDEKGMEWREEKTSSDEGDPQEFMIESVDSGSNQGTKSEIVIRPVPDTSKSGSYPIFHVYGVKHEDITAASEIPEMMLNGKQTYVEGMKWLRALDYEEDKAPQYEQSFNQRLASSGRDIKRLNRRKRRSISPRFPKGNPVI